MAGNSKIELPRKARKSEILEAITNIFFPKIISKEKLKLYTICKLLDFADFSSNISLSDMYDTIKMGILRFHFLIEIPNRGSNCK